MEGKEVKFEMESRTHVLTGGKLLICRVGLRGIAVSKARSVEACLSTLLLLPLLIILLLLSLLRTGKLFLCDIQNIFFKKKVKRRVGI